MKPRVVVSGASGQVGLFSIALLLASGFRVVALTRSEDPVCESAIPGLEICGMQAFLSSLAGQAATQRQVLLSCGPADLARALTRPKRGLLAAWSRVVIVGTTSTDSKQDSADSAERAQVARISDVIESVRADCAAEDKPCLVLKPTLIYGCGMDHNLSRVYRFIRKTGFAPIARCANGQRQPLHVADLATTLVRAVECTAVESLVSPVCGGSTLGYREMMETLFEVAQRPVRFMRIPRFAFPLIGGVSRATPGVATIHAEMFRRQSRDLVFDDEVARKQLGHAPRLFQPCAADFRLPPDIAAIHAQLNPQPA